MKTLPYNKAQIERIIKEYPTPFHIYDEAGIISAVEGLKAAFSWNSGFKEYFAVKALPNPVILKLLIDNGCGLDCSSYTELLLAKALGASGDDIMFSSNETPAEDFLLARELNAIINLDDITHIPFLNKNGGIPKTICCRFNPGGDFKIGTQIMGNPGDAKYGFTRGQLYDGFMQLKDLKAERFGLHAFLASNVTDKDYYPTLAREMFIEAVKLKKETGADIEFINLSGGIGIPYLPGAEPVDINWVGEKVKEAYDETFGVEGMEVKIYTELGRYITGPYGSLVTTAVHEKNIYKNYIGLDACAANLMRPAMYGSYHHVTVMGKENVSTDHVYDIVGSLCENNDKFAIDRALPKIDIGDIVVLHDTGAHGYAMGYNYNGKLRSKELLLKRDGTAMLIRREETPSDYFTTLDILSSDILDLDVLKS